MPLKPKSLLFHGKYRVIRHLGAGRFGAVYLVREEKYGVDRAIKILSAVDPGVGTTVYDDRRLRYRLEYQLGTRLDHPNVVRALAVEEEGETLGLVMEYAGGGSLAERLKRGRLEIEEALRLLRECARGLRAMHAMDAIHRDVKPSNILLMEDGRAKIADLGLVQVPGGPSGRSIQGDNALPHPGTPEYMSPEHRHPEALLPTSDVYSLGCVAWEMLSGTVWRSTMHKVRSLQDLRPEAPDWLDAVLRRMLSDTPSFRLQDAADLDRRFVDMQGLLEALALGGQTVACVTPPVDDRPSLARAVELLDAESFADALDMLEALRAAGMAPRSIEGLLAVARKGMEAAAHQNHILEEYQAITVLSRGKRTEHLALTDWEQFRTDHPDWTEDPADLRGWAERHPVTTERRRAAAQGEARRLAEEEAEARRKAESEARRKAAAAALRPIITPNQQRLLDTMLDPTRPAPERAEAGRELAELGDPRPGVGLRPDGLPDIKWVDVPAGPFIMGSDAHYDAEKPKRTVTLPAFRIGGYPVTYAQYKAFVDSPDGYGDRKWWIEPTKLSQREDQPGQQHWPISNHPAENVSWYDAVAFTRWLTTRLRAAGELKPGVEIRLATEEEWEKAARSTDRRDYPWGIAFRDGHANLIDGQAGQRLADLAKAGKWDDYRTEFWKDTTPGIKRTTAVGSYPQGASPFGALDMAGNVWEWTLTEFENKRSNDLSNARPRVVRGGSWYHNPDNARASYRRYNDPVFRFYYFGFRVVEAAPVS